MRLGRLVAAGLVAGAVAGFVGALLRPRTVQAYRPADRPATDARGDLAEASGPDGRSAAAQAGPLTGHQGSAGYALATSARDEGDEADQPDETDQADESVGEGPAEDGDALVQSSAATATPGPAAPVGTPGTAPTSTDGGPGARTLDVDAVPAAAPAVAAARGANG